MDGINLLPKACGEAGEAVITLSLTGTGNLPASRFTNPSPPLYTPRMEEVCRYGDVGKRRMAFPYLTPGQASILKKTYFPPYLFHVK